MFTLYKLIRNLFKALTSDAAPWQIFLGTFFGTLLGFLPIFPLSQGPSPIALILIGLVLVINVHLGSVFLFLGVTKLLSQVLHGPALLVGEQFSGLAQTCADIPFLHLSHWSHTGYLGLTLFGLVCAPLFAIVMYRFCLWFRVTWRDKLMEKARLLRAGSVVDHPWLVRLACWFFGID